MAWAMASLVPTPSVDDLDGLAVASAQREQAGEAAEAAADLRAGGAVGQRLEQFNGAIARLDIDAGGCVGDAGTLPRLLFDNSPDIGDKATGRGDRRPGTGRSQRVPTRSTISRASAKADVAAGEGALRTWMTAFS